MAGWALARIQNKLDWRLMKNYQKNCLPVASDILPQYNSMAMHSPNLCDGGSSGIRGKGNSGLKIPVIVRFTMYFCSKFMEISKPIHFWKA